MRLLPLQELTSADREAWGRLAAVAAEPNPFFEPGFLDVAAGALADEEICLMVDQREGDWTGCMPVRATRALGRTLALSTWRHHYSFLGTPLVDRDRCDEFAAALAGSALAGEHARFLALRQVGDGPVLAAIRAAAGAAGVAAVYEQSSERAVLRRRGDVDLLANLKPRRRKELERLRRRLGEVFDGSVATVEREDVDSAARDFLELELTGWKGEAGTAMASSPDSREFFTEMCRRMHGKGRLTIQSLQGNGRIAAMTCNLRVGEVEFGFKTAYDEDLRRYSPGLLHLIDVVSEFKRRGAQNLFDTCGDTKNKSLNALFPDRRALVTLTLGRPGPLSSLTGELLAAAYSPRGRRVVGKLRRG